MAPTPPHPLLRLLVSISFAVVLAVVPAGAVLRLLPPSPPVSQSSLNTTIMTTPSNSNAVTVSIPTATYLFSRQPSAQPRVVPSLPSSAAASSAMTTATAKKGYLLLVDTFQPNATCIPLIPASSARAHKDWTLALSSRQYTEIYVLVEWAVARSVGGCGTYDELMVGVELVFGGVVGRYSQAMANATRKQVKSALTATNQTAPADGFIDDGQDGEFLDASANDAASIDHAGAFPTAPNTLFIATAGQFPPNPFLDPAYHPATTLAVNHHHRGGKAELQVEFVPAADVRAWRDQWSGEAGIVVGTSSFGAASATATAASSADLMQTVVESTLVMASHLTMPALANGTMFAASSALALALDPSPGSFIATVHESELTQDAAAEWIRAWHAAGVSFTRHLFTALAAFVAAMALFRSIKRTLQQRHRRMEMSVDSTQQRRWCVPRLRVLAHLLVTLAAVSFAVGCQAQVITRIAMLLRAVAVMFSVIALHLTLMLWMRQPRHAALHPLDTHLPRYLTLIPTVIKALRRVCGMAIVAVDIVVGAVFITRAVIPADIGNVADLVPIAAWLQFAAYSAIFLLHALLSLMQVRLRAHYVEQDPTATPLPKSWSCITALFIGANLCALIVPLLPTLAFQLYPVLVQDPIGATRAHICGDAVVLLLICLVSLAVSDRGLSRHIEAMDRVDLPGYTPDATLSRGSSVKGHNKVTERATAAAFDSLHAWTSAKQPGDASNLHVMMAISTPLSLRRRSSLMCSTSMLKSALGPIRRQSRVSEMAWLERSYLAKPPSTPSTIAPLMYQIPDLSMQKGDSAADESIPQRQSFSHADSDSQMHHHSRDSSTFKTESSCGQSIVSIQLDDGVSLSNNSHRSGVSSSSSKVVDADLAPSGWMDVEDEPNYTAYPATPRVVVPDTGMFSHVFAPHETAKIDQATQILRSGAERDKGAFQRGDGYRAPWAESL